MTEPKVEFNEILARWSYLRNALAHSRLTLDRKLCNELFELQNGVRETIGGGTDVHPQDPRVLFVLDVLAALSATESDDAAHPWSRAGLLFQVGRYLEAADDFVLAAERFRAEHRARTGLTGDEDEWADAALYHAAMSYALGGQAFAAAALLPRLRSEENREEVRRMVDAATLPAAAG